MADEKKDESPSSLDHGASKEEKQVALGSSPGSTVDLDATYGVNEKALLRKLDFKILPALTLLYLLSFLDRSNGSLTLSTHLAKWRSGITDWLQVANARIEGLTVDLHMSMSCRYPLSMWQG